MILQSFSSVNVLVTGYLKAVHANHIRNWSTMKTVGFIQMALLTEKLSCVTVTLVFSSQTCL